MLELDCEVRKGCPLEMFVSEPPPIGLFLSLASFTDPTLIGITLLATTIMMFAALAYRIWMRERSYREESQKRLDERENKRIELEERRISAEEMARYETNKREEDKLTGENAGPGSGGYIVMEMPESERPLFHDLLKGFEDYAKIKGYHIAFSIDSSFDGRIAFKFTVKNDGFVVGPERVRQDFKEYVEKIRNGQVEDLDDLPIVVTQDEHNLLIAMVKNRMNFLQHSYQLAKTAAQYYETILSNVRSFPALPAANVIVQTGGNMDTRKYLAKNSSHLIQGDANTYTDSSTNIDIGKSFNDRQARISALDDLIVKLKSSGDQDESAAKAQRELGKVRDELAEYPQPDESSIKKWLEYAKGMLSTATLSVEIVEAGKKLYELFGL